MKRVRIFLFSTLMILCLFSNAQTFDSIPQVEAYINSNIKPNGARQITATHLNNAFLGMLKFVKRQLGINTTPTGTNFVTPTTIFWSGSGYKYYVSASKYYVNGKYCENSYDSITLSAAHGTYGRFVVIGLDTGGHVFQLTGIAAANPVVPTIDPTYQIRVTNIFVPAASIAPTDVLNYSIYNENAGEPNEWDASIHSGMVDPNSTDAASNGSKSIHFNNAFSGNFVILNKPLGEKISDKTNLYFKVKFTTFGKVLSGTVENYLLIYFSHGSNNDYIGYTFLKHGSYGLDTTNKTDWQRITIPISDFGIQTDSVNGLVIIASSYPDATNNGTKLFIDEVGFQSGLSTPPAVTGGVDKFNGRKGNVVPLKADYSQWFEDIAKVKGVFYVSENYTGTGAAVVTSLSNSGVSSSNSSYTLQLSTAKMGTIANPFPDPWTARNAALDSIANGSISDASIYILKGNFTIGSNVSSNNGDSLGNVATVTVADIGFSSANGTTVAPLMRNKIFYYFEKNTGLTFINKNYVINGGGYVVDASHNTYKSGILGSGYFLQVYGNLELFYPNFITVNNSRAEIFFEADNVVGQEFFFKTNVFKTIDVKIREFRTHKRGSLVNMANGVGENNGDGTPSTMIFDVQNCYKGYNYFPYPSINGSAGYTPLIGLDYSSATRLKTYNFKFKNLFNHDVALHTILNAWATGGARDVYNHSMTIDIDYFQHDLNTYDQTFQTVAGALFQPISHGNGTSYIRENVHSTLNIKTAIVDHSLVSIRLIAPTNVASKNNSVTVNVNYVLRRYKIATIAASVGIENLFVMPYLMQTSSGVVAGEKVNVIFNVNNAIAKFGNVFGASGVTPIMFTGANTTITGTYITEDGSPVMELNVKGEACVLKNAIFIAKGEVLNSIIVNNGGNVVKVFGHNFLTNLATGAGITQEGVFTIDPNISSYY